MGMTREEIVKSMSLQDAIEVLKDTNTYGTADIAKSVAIDIMRKYKEIEQIIKEIPYGGDATVRRIQEVIEDENDDL
jgi:hypothetical protein